MQAATTAAPLTVSDGLATRCKTYNTEKDTNPSGFNQAKVSQPDNNRTCLAALRPCKARSAVSSMRHLGRSERHLSHAGQPLGHYDRAATLLLSVNGIFKQIPHERAYRHRQRKLVAEPYLWGYYGRRYPAACKRVVIALNADVHADRLAHECKIASIARSAKIRHRGH